ncbi:MAG TPA: acetyl-CoA carboxylase biotin carboxyl carrier protein subunit [Turneriella sp.]|nr:acetyl-CoA carboxylase biotin carboxyl carrier protein subunit [Turneriella sp.]
MRRYLLRHDQTVLSRIVSNNQFTVGTAWNIKKALPFAVTHCDLKKRVMTVRADGKEHIAHFHQTNDGIELVLDGFFYRFTNTPFSGSDSEKVHHSEIRSEIPGRIVKICAAVDQVVEQGTALIIQEAMKMEITLVAPARVKIQEVLVEAGSQVDADVVLIRFEAAPLS